MNDFCATVAICDEDSIGLATDELKRAGAVVKRVAPGALLIEEGLTFKELALAARRGDFVFSRSLNPVHYNYVVPPSCEALADIAQGLAQGVTLSSWTVHVNILGEVGEVTERSLLAKAIQEGVGRCGGTYSRSEPGHIFSMVITPKGTFIGVAEAPDCLSTWPAGEIRFRQEPSQVSRSEFKLLEGINVFGLQIADGQRALDLGAAPGGWTRVLAQRGVQVVAVDPAPLDVRCAKLRGVSFVQDSAEAFLGRGKTGGSQAPFDLMVNDMRMDPIESAILMNRFASRLTPHGQLFMTLKLPRGSVRDTWALIGKAREHLEKNFEIKGVRQLFHNRSEVSVLALVSRT